MLKVCRKKTLSSEYKQPVRRPLEGENMPVFFHLYNPCTILLALQHINIYMFISRRKFPGHNT